MGAEVFAFSERSVPTPASTVNDIVTEEYWMGSAMNTARLFTCDTATGASDLSSTITARSSPVFVYEYRAQHGLVPPTAGFRNQDLPDGNTTTTDLLQPVPGSAGVPHAVDLYSIFNASDTSLPQKDRPYWYIADPDGYDKITEEQKQTLSATMSQAWIDFAKHQDPGFDWKPWTAEQPTRAVFDYNTNSNGVENEKADRVVTQCKLVNQFVTDC